MTIPTPDPFDNLDVQHAGEDRFARNPQNRPELGAARTSDTVAGVPTPRPKTFGEMDPAERSAMIRAAGAKLAAELSHPAFVAALARIMAESKPARTERESIEVGPVSVDEIGPVSSCRYEIGLWDNAEGAYVHGMMLPDREAAEALYRALGRILYG